MARLVAQRISVALEAVAVGRTLALAMVGAAALVECLAAAAAAAAPAHPAPQAALVGRAAAV
jgi:hypothetical protein